MRAFIFFAISAALLSSFRPVPQATPYPECEIQVTYNVTHTTIGKSEGAIEITLSGGAAPYEVNWIGHQEKFKKGLKITNLKEGYYSVHVVDSKRCIKIVSNIKVESK